MFIGKPTSTVIRKRGFNAPVPVVNNNLVVPVANVTTTGQIQEQLKEIAKIDRELPELEIIGTEISTISTRSIKDISVLLIGGNLNQINNINSNSLGPTAPNLQCEKCFRIDCPGHWSYIDFGSDTESNREQNQIYIPNPLYAKPLLRTLNAVCTSCKKIRVSKNFLEENGVFNMAPGIKRLKFISKLVNSRCMANSDDPTKICNPNPTYVSGNFKESGLFTVKYDDSKVPSNIDGKSMFSILNGISDEDSAILGFNKHTHPRDFIMRNMLVMPPVARPMAYYNGRMNQDSLTTGYNQVYLKVQKAIKSPGSNNLVKDVFTEIYKLFAKKSETGGSYQKVISIVKHLQGKDALVRDNMVGKRIDMCARTVIVGDTENPLGYISLPAIWQQRLSRKEKVTYWNLAVIKELIKDNNVYYITNGQTGERKYRTTSDSIKIGDIVEVKITNDAIVTFGRQPTLSTQSFMASQAIFRKDILAMGIPLCVTPTFNADFDGDEMHCEVPQGVEAEVEARELLFVNNNILSNSAPVPTLRLVMNAVIGSYLLTDPSYNMPLFLYQVLLSNINNPDSTFLQRTYDMNLDPLSGKALYSNLFPADFYYRNKGITIVQGLLLSGQLTKAHVGGGSRSIIHDLVRYYGNKRTAVFLTEATRLCNNWLLEHGFTVGESDLTVIATDDDTDARVDLTRHIIEQKLNEFYLRLYAIYQEQIDLTNLLEVEHRERQVVEAIHSLGEYGQLLLKALDKNNIITLSDQKSGTKSDLVNAANITTIIGQYFVDGSTVKPDINGRTLPCFDAYTQDPQAYGFVASSYTQGQAPSDFFFGHKAARGPICDTASRTPKTGDMQRKVTLTAENITISENGCVVNNDEFIITTHFNGGLEINKTMGSLTPIDVRSKIKSLNAKYGYVPKDIPLGTDMREKYKNYYAKNGISGVARYLQGNDSTVAARCEKIKVPNPHFMLTRYEVAKLLGIRARMLEEGAIPLVTVTPTKENFRSRSPVDIAYREYNEGKLVTDVCNLKIMRTYPDRTYDIIDITADRLPKRDEPLAYY